MKKRIKYSADKDLEVIFEADCVVVGAGPSGCAAAILAARQGVKVLLIEKYGFAGGAAVSQLVPVILSQNGRDFPPIWHEWILEMKRCGNVGDMIKGEQHAHWYSATYTPESAKLAWDNLLHSADVSLLFHSQVIDVIKKDSVIQSVVIANRGKMYSVTGKVFIDCTGDGNLALISDESMFVEESKSHVSQASTKMFRLNHAIKPERLLTDEKKIKLVEDFNRAIESKYYNSPAITSGYILKYILNRAGKQLPDNTLLINAIRIIQVDPLDPFQVTKAEIDGRKSAIECTDFFRKYVPGSENAELCETSIELGVRASRSIDCLYNLSIHDILSFRSFEDSIAKGSWEIDVHPPNSFEYGKALQTTGEYNSFRNRIIEGECYEIPFRALVPKNTKNLLIAGRCIGSDSKSQGTIRIQQTCMATGSAAGIAAAVCIKDNNYENIAVHEVKSLLDREMKTIIPAFRILESMYD